MCAISDTNIGRVVTPSPPFPGVVEPAAAAVREPGRSVLPAHDVRGAEEDLRAHQVLRGVQGQAGVREGAPGEAAPLRHPGAHRGGGL